MRDASDNTLSFIPAVCLDPSFRLTCLPAAHKHLTLAILSEETFNSLNRTDFERLQSSSTRHDSTAVQAQRKMVWCEMSRQSEAVVPLRDSAEYRNRSSQTARTTKQRRTSMTRCSEDLSSSRCLHFTTKCTRKSHSFFGSLASGGAKRGKSAAGRRVSGLTANEKSTKYELPLRRDTYWKGWICKNKCSQFNVKLETWKHPCNISLYCSAMWRLQVSDMCHNTTWPQMTFRLHGRFSSASFMPTCKNQTSLCRWT